MAISIRNEKRGNTKILRITAPDSSKYSTILKTLSDKYTLTQLQKYIPENSGVTNIDVYLKSKELVRPMFYGKISRKMLMDWYKLENKK